MMELIDKKKALADLKGIKDVLVGAGDPFLASIIIRAINCIEEQPVIALYSQELPEGWHVRHMSKWFPDGSNEEDPDGES